MDNSNAKTTLTDEQIDLIASELDEEIKGTDLEDLANLPSNQGKEERDESEISETGESKKMMVAIDPNTGENKIIGPADDDKKESFEETCARLESGNININNSPITEEEIRSVISESGEGIISEMTENYSISDDSVRELLFLVNKKKNNETFNVYKSYPEEIQNMIDTYMNNNGMSGNTMQAKQTRNMIAEALLDEFISNIELSRIQSDFTKEVEDLFNKGSEELAETIVGYTIERNKTYREAAEKMEDEDKKAKLISILDAIDSAYSLDGLIEFAKKCRVKKFELDKPSKVYNSFLMKYENSSYNIYNLDLCRPILVRNLRVDVKFVDLFLITFCKYCQNMKPDNVTEHAFMYYTIYNIVLIDMNRSENTKAVSEEFLENIKKVIDNAKERNNM